MDYAFTGQSNLNFDDKSSLLEPISKSAQQVAISSVLLAASVAWSDGVVQLNEKNKLIEMAEREQEIDPEFPFDKVMSWLNQPPSEKEVEGALAILAQDPMSSQFTDKARKIAEAHGSIGLVVGIGAGALLGLMTWILFNPTVGIFVGLAVMTAFSLNFLIGDNSISDEEKTALNWLNTSLNKGGEIKEKQISRSNWKQRIGTLRTVMDERSLAVRQERWEPTIDTKPIPCPQYPGRMPPSVTDIPEHEYQEFRSKIVKRYVQGLIGETWSALEVSHNIPETLDDAMLNEIYWQSPFSRFLTPKFTTEDLELFDAFFKNKTTEQTFYKIDHTHLKDQNTYPGIYIAPVIGIFRKTSDGIEVIAISVAENCFTPNDGESWERARLFLLQGSSLALVGGVHASLHFPTDSVIAITRKMIPPKHPIARVIEAHAYLQLPLNYGVRWSPRSYAHNSPRELYTAFPGPREDVFHGFMTHYEGIDGNEAYPAYQFPLKAPELPGPYGHALNEYYNVILEFCRTVTNQCDLSVFESWADELQSLIPGFPSGKTVNDAEKLARILAGFVHSVSVWHYMEHTLYSQLPVHHNPHRIRVEPPTGSDSPTEWWQRTRQSDLFRQEIARRMFYDSHTVRRMLDVEYGFEEIKLKSAVDDFKKKLREVDNSLPKKYQLLDDMACSIQF